MITKKSLTQKKFLEYLANVTYKESLELTLRHANQNKKYIKKTIKDLNRYKHDQPCVLVSGGPSLHRKNHISVLKHNKNNICIVVADSALGHCLRNGIVPEFVVTVDPDPQRIIRWFGDPQIHNRPEDDYFKRQDIDPELNQNEIEKNDELINLINEYGSKIKLIICTCVSHEVTQRCIDAEMELFWWNPLLDDFNDTNSYSRKLNTDNGAPCMVTGGNVGASSWVFASAILKCDPILMVGMDYSYPPKTDAYHTQYFHALKELFPETPDEGLIEIYNPHLKETWLTDPVYYWYRENFYQMLESVDKLRTINCTEGGILFGKKIQWSTFEKAIQEIQKK